jgi:hypothetical protein
LIVEVFSGWRRSGLELRRPASSGGACVGSGARIGRCGRDALAGAAGAVAGGAAAVLASDRDGHHDGRGGVDVGVSVPVGSRWFRHAGGMPPISLAEPTGRYLSFEEREEIAICCAPRQARRAGDRPGSAVIRGRSPASCAATPPRVAGSRSTGRRSRSGRRSRRPSARRPRSSSPTTGCASTSRTRSAGSHAGRMARSSLGRRHRRWKGLNKPHRQDRGGRRRGARSRSRTGSEVDFPDDESMRISHEAIYQSLFIEGRGALKRELVACLRTGRALRAPRERSRRRPRAHVTADVVSVSVPRRPRTAPSRALGG